MRKLLIGTSALVAAVSLAGVASAAEPIKLSIGGTGSGYVAYASQKDSYLKATGIESNAVDVKGKNEISFTGKTTLDNGLTITAQYVYKAGGKEQNKIIDKWRIYTAGTFGEIRMASEDPATDVLSVGGPIAGVKIFGDPIDNDVPGKLVLKPEITTSATDWAALTTDAQRARSRDGSLNVNTGLAVGAGDDASESIAYYTPAIYGFKFGTSYHPSARIGNDNNAPSSNTGANQSDDMYTFGGQFVNTFGDFGVKLGAGYAVRDVTSTERDLDQGAAIDEHSDWGFGGVMTYKGFGVNARYRKTEQSNADRLVALGERSSLDKTTWQAGLTYQANPYTIQLQYENAKGENRTVGMSDDKLWQIQLTGQYVMGPGVTLEAAVAYVDMENGTVSTDSADTKNQSENNGWVVGTGLSLAF